MTFKKTVLAILFSASFAYGEATELAVGSTPLNENCTMSLKGRALTQGEIQSMIGQVINGYAVIADEHSRHTISVDYAQAEDGKCNPGFIALYRGDMGVMESDRSCVKSVIELINALPACPAQ